MLSGINPGGPDGLWTWGPLRTLRSLYKRAGDFARRTAGMTYEEAKEFAMEFKSVVNPPFPIVSDLDLPTLFFVEIDALHCILLGKIKTSLQK